MEENLDARQKIRLFDYDWLNSRLVDDREKVLLRCNRMTKQFYQLRARFEDRLKVFRTQSQEEARGESRQSSARRHAGQKRNLTEGVAGSELSYLEYSTVLYSTCDLDNAVEN